MKVKLSELPSTDLMDVLRFAKTMAESAGIKKHSIRITKTHLIINGTKREGIPGTTKTGQDQTGVETEAESEKTEGAGIKGE